MRVAIISPTFGGYGGLEAFVLALGNGLAGLPDLEARVVFKTTRDGVLQPEMARMLAAAPCRPEVLPRASLALVQAIAWADVVHVQNPAPDVVMLTRLLGRRLLVNVINHRLAGQTLHQRLWDGCLRLAQRRFYISDFVRHSWEGSRPWSNSTVVFPICRLISGTKPSTARKGFVFAGRWIANKGIDLLVEAYARAGLKPEDWPLILIGDGPLRPGIQRRVAELGLKGVTMPGFLSEEDKAEAIRSARFMVIPPNTGEDFGLTAIEARNAGVPCLITRDGGLPEAAGADALVCEPGDVDGLTVLLRQAAAMAEAEYTRRAERTHTSLGGQLRPPSFYADVYRSMAAA